MSGSVALDGSAAQPLLAEPGATGAGGAHGLRHFMVPQVRAGAASRPCAPTPKRGARCLPPPARASALPRPADPALPRPQHLHWPDALGHAALAVYLTPSARADLRQAAAEFLSALPRLGVEGVAALTAALPPILRLAELPGEQLEGALDALLRSGRTLLLQARRRAHPGAAAARGLGATRLLLRLHGQRGSRAPMQAACNASLSARACTLITQPCSPRACTEPRFCPPTPTPTCRRSSSCTARCPRAWTAGGAACAMPCCSWSTARTPQSSA